LKLKSMPVTPTLLPNQTGAKNGEPSALRLKNFRSCLPFLSPMKQGVF
jgi:hypothetical protein